VTGAVLLVSLLAVGCDEVDENSESFTVTMPGESMEPTIKAGSRVTVTRIPEDFEPERSQIVLLDDPGGRLGPEDDGEGMLLKRVIGVSGDTVTCCDESGRIVVNGAPLDEPYIAEPDACAGAGGITGCHWKAGPVPAGKIFVLGDNRGFSADSRAYMCNPARDPCSVGPWVDVDLIKGTINAQ